jgi:ATP-dependent Lhr-like helicase
VLLTTPESLEVILVSTRAGAREFLRDLRVAIADEIHAFAGDDRGWHLLAVLERITRLGGRGPVQRLGLSATVGNPAELLDWLAGRGARRRRVIAPDAAALTQAEVTLDYVGNLENAAVLLSRLHRGEKRLVFADSRARVEQLAALLRKRQVATFVSHGSLGLDQRRQAEAAFAGRTDCVIVATSTLELGIDVGDLDRVIQLEGAPSVSSFLQRMGRTGRRAGTARNCLFLATRPDELLRAAGLAALWARGRVDPVVPPPLPYHVLAQQLMTLCLQEGRLGDRLWREWLGGFLERAGLGPDGVNSLVQHLVEGQWLAVDEGLLATGPRMEQQFGHRHYLELCSVFTGEPLFTVLQGRNEIGKVHPLSFSRPEGVVPVVLLAGRSWRVTSIDWRHQEAFVEPVEDGGASQWMGSGRPDTFDHCRAMREVLLTGEVPATLTKRASKALDELRADHSWVVEDGTVVVTDENGRRRWWTFAGLLANVTLAAALGSDGRSGRKTDNLSLELPEDQPAMGILGSLGERASETEGELNPPIDARAIEGLKFSECMPPSLALATLRRRASDARAVAAVLGEPVSVVGDALTGSRDR